MGYAQAFDMATIADRETALKWHLGYNCFPPMSAFYDAAVAALEAYESEEFTTPVSLPNGRTVSASDVITHLHLDAFVDAGTCTFDEDE